MPRFILRYRGSGPAPADDMQKVRSIAGLATIDSSERMLLVDGPEASVRAAVENMLGWSMTPEQTIPLPDTRKKIQNPPD